MLGVGVVEMSQTQLNALSGQLWAQRKGSSDSKYSAFSPRSSDFRGQVGRNMMVVGLGVKQKMETVLDWRVSLQGHSNK